MYICSKHIVHNRILHWRPRNYKHYYCQLEKQLCIDQPEYRSLFTASKTRLVHPQHDKDKIPKDYDLVYQNRLSRIIGPARVIATATGLTSASLSAACILNFPENLEPWEVYALSGICLFSLFSIVFVNVMFRFYLLKIYFNKDSSQFIGVYHSFLGNVKQVKYNFSDLQAVKRPMTNAMHTKCNIHISGRRFHLKGGDFVLPKYYNMHLGLQ